MHSPSRYLLIITLCFSLLPCGVAWAELRVRDVCRVKGQEENTLQGLGLVVGLNGTGDGDAPTTRALARTMQLMGLPVGKGDQGQPMLDELKNARNVALVFVTATVPAAGARQGDELNCQVNAISAKSLEGGYLMMTPLLGPRPGNTRIYGFAQGALTLTEAGPATSAVVHSGCRLEENFDNAFQEDGKFTLVLKENHAGFQAAWDIEYLINSMLDVRGNYGAQAQPSPGTRPADAIARALDPKNIEVTIPSLYRETPVEFIAAVLDVRITSLPNKATVLINERAGVIVVGEEVEIRPVAISHKNLSIETGGTPIAGQFVPVDPASNTSTTKLKALVEALNALQVPTQDKIDIIKGLERSGDLYGRLILE